MSLNLSEINKSIDFFRYIYSYLGYFECLKLYGNKVGEHLWKKKQTYEHRQNSILWDVEHFFEDLEVMNKKVLIDWYNKNNIKETNNDTINGKNGI